jgi:hypothetical protein
MQKIRILQKHYLEFTIQGTFQTSSSTTPSFACKTLEYQNAKNVVFLVVVLCYSRVPCSLFLHSNVANPVMVTERH